MGASRASRAKRQQPLNYPQPTPVGSRARSALRGAVVLTAVALLLLWSSTVSLAQQTEEQSAESTQYVIGSVTINDEPAPRGVRVVAPANHGGSPSGVLTPLLIASVRRLESDSGAFGRTSPDRPGRETLPASLSWRPSLGFRRRTRQSPCPSECWCLLPGLASP